MPKPFCVGQIGVVFEVEIIDNGVAVPIDSATVTLVKFSKPDGTEVEQPGTFVTNGADGLLSYMTVAGDLDQAGRWTVRGYVEMPTFTGNGTISPFLVEP